MPLQSFAADLRARSDAELADLLTRRPDLARPAPSTITALAARATSRSSVQRAVEALDTAHLQVLIAVLAQGGDADPASTCAVLRVEAPTGTELVGSALERLWADALLARGDDADPDRYATVRAVGELRLPAPVADRMRSGDAAGRLIEPTLTWSPVDAARCAGAAGSSAATLIDLTDDLLAAWAIDPPRVLRTGGIGVREVTRVAADLGIDIDLAVWLVELVVAADLVDDDADAEPLWTPTARVDEWEAAGPGRRWAMLAAGWLAAARAWHTGRTDPTPAGLDSPRRSAPTGVLGPDLTWSAMRTIRAEVLAILAEGTGAADPEGISAVLRWRHPLRSGPMIEAAVSAVLREAEWIGATGAGRLSPLGDILSVQSAQGRGTPSGPGPDLGELATVADQQLPAQIDHVLVQADQTVVAPGPLTGALGSFIRLVADLESRGGASVSRLTPTSIRRALDTGLSAEELLERLRAASRTPVPQPIEYLVRDVARRHGQVRTGPAGGYLRSDDPAALDAILAERRLSALGLRRIAPTVLVHHSDPAHLLEALRENGFSPTAESADGTTVTMPVPRRRSNHGRRTPVVATERPRVNEIVTHLRAGELRAAELAARGPELPVTEPAVAQALLREAAATRSPMTIAYADARGHVSRVEVEPVRVDGGRLTAVVDGEQQTYSVHRIVGVAARP